MLSSSLTIYHSRGPKSMGVEGAERGEGGGEKRLFTQIAALRVCNQRARGERKKKKNLPRDSGSISLFTLLQELPEC